MDTQSLSTHQTNGIATESYCDLEFIHRLHVIAKCIPELKQTGENFTLWERHLIAMIGSITGSPEYLMCDSQKPDPKLNRAVFHLIFWSIDEELQHGLNMKGSAGDAFQFLADRFRPNHCIIGRPDFPEEILENIVNIVHFDSSKEEMSIRERKLERMVEAPLDQGSEYEVYPYQCGPPILNSFQNLAVVNRKFHRLCLPKLWQHLEFPSGLPAPMSLWTHDILLHHGNLVKSFGCKLDNHSSLTGNDELLEIQRSFHDNTKPCNGSPHLTSNGIGLINLRKIFKACPCLQSVVMDIPGDSYNSESFSPIRFRLRFLFGLVPQLKRLRVYSRGFPSLPGEFMIDLLKELPSLESLELGCLDFVQKPLKEDSLGWNLAQHQNLRSLSLQFVDCQDETWTLNSWPRKLTSLAILSCRGLTPIMVPKLFDGSAPFLTKLWITFAPHHHDPAVDGQADLPALKHLNLFHPTRFDLLVNFQECKEIEKIEYHLPIDNQQWELVKHLLSRCTWPKLSVLDLCHSTRMDEDDQNNRKTLTKEDVDEIWNSFKVKLLINSVKIKRPIK